MPQLNSDEAANDEPKTYNDENGMGQDPERDWHETAELNDLKGDLVGEVDPDPRRPSYDNKVNSSSTHRNKESLERDNESAGAANFPYSQPDIGAIAAVTAGFN